MKWIIQKDHEGHCYVENEHTHVIIFLENLKDKTVDWLLKQMEDLDVNLSERPLQ